MSQWIKEIPKSFEYTCARCGAVHIQESAHGHYTESLPVGWAWLRTLAQAGYKREEFLFCSSCADFVNQLVTHYLFTKEPK